MTIQKNKVLGITGYPGTGKSTLARMLRWINIPIQEADHVVAQLFQRPAVIHDVAKSFPSVIQDHKVNKEKLAAIVFRDPQKLKQLEEILHPLVYQEHQHFIQEHSDKSLVVLEIPLLFETGRETLCDMVLYTTCPQDMAWERVKKRGWSKERYQTTIERLLPESVKKQKSQVIIDTSRSKVNSWHQLKDALQDICNIRK